MTVNLTELNYKFRHTSTNYGKAYLLEYDSAEKYQLSWTNERRLDNLTPKNITELLSYNKTLHRLTMRPKKFDGVALVDQYTQIKEFIIDYNNSPWGFDTQNPLYRGIDRQGENVVCIHGMPDYFGKIPEFGLGFPRKYRRIIKAIESATECTSVKFCSCETSSTDGDEFTLTFNDLKCLITIINRTFDRASRVGTKVCDNNAYNFIRAILGEPSIPVSLGRIAEIRMMTREVSDLAPPSSDDIEDIANRLGSHHKQTRDLPSRDSMMRLKASIEIASLDQLVDAYKEALECNRSKKEDFWQEYFKENRFILQQLLTTPLEYYADQVHVGEIDLTGRGDRIVDFMLRNPVSRLATLVEIKTPSSPLTPRKPYRGNVGSEVYGPSKDLGGGIAQLQSQINSAYTSLKPRILTSRESKIIDLPPIDGILIIGRIDSLDDNQKNSFNSFRHFLHGITIITFDEILERLTHMRDTLNAGTPDIITDLREHQNFSMA